MSRWFRMYDELLDDPKVQRLPAEDFRGWVNLLCLASRNSGKLPPVADIAFALRETLDAVSTLVERLRRAGLIERRSGGSDGAYDAPYKWAERQYKSDTSTDRVKRFRERSKKQSGNSVETPPDTETEADTEKKNNNPPKGGYAFDGRVIKLSRRDFSAWRKAYPDLDLAAKLQSRDDWLAFEATDKDRERWFMSTSNYLANLQQKAAAAERAPVWDGMP